MTDLPRGKDETRPRSAWAIFILGGFEALTTALRRGNPIRDVDDLQLLAARSSAFCAALDARMKQHGMDEEVLEDFE